LSTSLEPVPSSSPPLSLRAIIKSSSEPLHRRSQPRSRPLQTAIFPNPSRCRRRQRGPHPQARDTVLEPTTTSSSSSLRHCAPHAVPEPVTSTTLVVPGRVRNAVLLPEPATSRACDAVELTSSLSLQRRSPPQAHKATLYSFLCHFGPTNLDFDMLHYHIALICYIYAFVLLHCFDMLHCHIALIFYIVTFL
jgi:hypothetical protein